MSSGRNRDYRKSYRANVSRNSWQPYPQRRPQFLQRSRRSEEEDDLFPEARLIDSALKVCNSRVEFESVPHSSLARSVAYQGRAKVIVLRTYGVSDAPQIVRTPSRNQDCSPVKSLPNSVLKANGVQKAEQPKTVVEEDPDGPPVPKVSLFSESRIVLGWKKAFPTGAGMCNLGNTCYLNSTLQALFYIPSFCNWLLSELDHDENSGCKELDDNGEKCIICAMATTLKILRNKSGSAIKPYLIYNRLKAICKHMSYGRQEDAHEFLRYLLEKIELSYLERFKGKQLENASKETTPVHRIFGGYMRSEICCLFCKGTSTTFQHFQDIMLDIRRTSSLDEALQLFFSRESLEGDEGVGGDGGGDAYKCSKCHRKGHCVKRNSIQMAPKVLCFQLKRFSVMGGKLVKHISYPEKLDMSAYLHHKHSGQTNSSPYNQRQPSSLMYHLISIVSHCGTSMNSGHYTATAKSPNGDFYEFDDAFVHQVPLHSALDSSAYILMYEMVPPRDEGTPSYTPLKSTSSAYTPNGSLSSSAEKIRPFAMPSNRPKMLFGPSPRPTNGVVSSLPSFSSTSLSNSHNTSSSNATALPPAKDREKVLFGIKSSSQTTSNGYSHNNHSSRLNGACIIKSRPEPNQNAAKKPSPEPKTQNSVMRTSPKVNGSGESPTKANKSPQSQGNSTWNSNGNTNGTKTVRQPTKIPYPVIECNQTLSAGAASESNGREGAEKSLDRLSKLGVLVGVSGKNREGECASGTVDHHLVSYSVLSGESSDEEEERRGKRSRKSSESSASKHQGSASEMTISGNLTADATAIAASRGWNITGGSSATKGNREFQKTVDTRVTETSPNSRKELPVGSSRVEVPSVVNHCGRERTERNGSSVSPKSEVKKLKISEDGEGYGVITNGEHSERLEERQNGTSQPSSPCSSTSSNSSDSCPPLQNGTTAFKSILKIIDRSNCSLMEDGERKDLAESPSKLKGLPNGTGNIVMGEGAVGEESGVICKVMKWLNECEFDAVQNDCIGLDQVVNLSPVVSPKKEDFGSKTSVSKDKKIRSKRTKISVGSKSRRKRKFRRKLNEKDYFTKDKSTIKRRTRSLILKSKYSSKMQRKVRKSYDIKSQFAWEINFPHPKNCFCDNEFGSEVSFDEVNIESEFKTKIASSSGSLASDLACAPRESNDTVNRVDRSSSVGSLSSTSISSLLGQVSQSSGASSVPVLSRADARSLISNPS